MHVHLDPIGGLAGDMFVAAVLDAWPQLADELQAVLKLTSLPDTVTAQIVSHHDHGLQGKRFLVRDTAKSHSHVHFHDIRNQLANSTLPSSVKERAIDIFALLAEAEGQVHGIQPDAVTFHEVGAWDSIADIVASACLIDSLAAQGWSVSALPLGSGRVRTAHGILPVPAPATARLLEGFVVQDDGRDGERVTPTGAAILKHLATTYRAPAYPMIMGRTGIGFGTRQLDGIPNMLRLLALEPQQAQQTDKVAVLHFEIDDQPAEDLAVGLERLRNLSAVIDVVQIPALGKRGRLATQIQILARPEALYTVVEQCFAETTTLGLRWQIVHRSILARRQVEYRNAEQRIGVKVAQRPGGASTGKAEIDDVAQTTGGFAERARLRRMAEQTILEQQREHDED